MAEVRLRSLSDEEALARARVLAEAESWLRTPFHHEARVKGHGADCAMLLAEVYERAGQVPHASPEHYPPDWHIHRGEERYLLWLLRHAREIEDPAPADVVLFRMGRTWSHGGIVVRWPIIIHAWYQTCVELNDASKEPLERRPRRFFTLREWK